MATSYIPHSRYDICVGLDKDGCISFHRLSIRICNENDFD